MDDFKFEKKHSPMEAMFSETEGRYEAGLSDEDLERVSGAGDGQRVMHADSLGYDLTAVPVIDLPLEDRL